MIGNTTNYYSELTLQKRVIVPVKRALAAAEDHAFEATLKYALGGAVLKRLPLPVTPRGVPEVKIFTGAARVRPRLPRSAQMLLKSAVPVRSATPPDPIVVPTPARGLVVAFKRPPASALRVPTHEPPVITML